MNPEIPAVFKILALDKNKNLRSFCHHSLATEEYERKVFLPYSVNKITYPIIPGSKLMAFKTLEDAKQFYDLENCTGLKIFLCEAKLSDTNPCTIPSVPWSTLNEIEYFWENRPKFKRGTLRCKIPPGTIFCDWIRPVVEIK
jgi:hypothetical protein